MFLFSCIERILCRLQRIIKFSSSCASTSAIDHMTWQICCGEGKLSVAQGIEAFFNVTYRLLLTWLSRNGTNELQ